MPIRAPSFRSCETGPLRGLLIDLLRSKQELLAENALLRQQLIVAARLVKKPQFRPSERMLLVALSAMFAQSRQASVLVQPETLLRSHYGARESPVGRRAHSRRAAQARFVRRYEHNPGIHRPFSLDAERAELVDVSSQPGGGDLVV